jgi:hypothetical protein
MAGHRLPDPLQFRNRTCFEIRKTHILWIRLEPPLQVTDRIDYEIEIVIDCTHDDGGFVHLARGLEIRIADDDRNESASRERSRDIPAVLGDHRNCHDAIVSVFACQFHGFTLR